MLRSAGRVLVVTRAPPLANVTSSRHKMLPFGSGLKSHSFCSSFRSSCFCVPASVPTGMASMTPDDPPKTEDSHHHSMKWMGMKRQPKRVRYKWNIVSIATNPTGSCFWRRKSHQNHSMKPWLVNRKPSWWLMKRIPIQLSGCPLPVWTAAKQQTRFWPQRNGRSYGCKPVEIDKTS